MKCTQVQKYLHAHLDGELGADLSLEIEKHLAECTRCREQMDFEVRFIDQVRSEMRTTEDTRELEKRIGKSLEKEGRRKTNVRVFARVTMLAAAASVILVVGILVRQSVQQKGDLPPIGISDEVVKTHAKKMPMEINNADEQEVAKWFEGKLDFPVQPPKFASGTNARLVGARISRIKEKDAAQLVYDVNGHRLTFMIFDPGEHAEEIEAEKVKRPTKPIPLKDGWVTTHRGYSVGLYQRRGITYTVASDVGEGDIIKLISSIDY
jgi:anti-sigma factor RsiW